VHHKQLIHNLRKRRIPHVISLWIANFLQNQSTQLQFNGAKSKYIPTPADIPQGSPLSPLLYMYYNTDLLNITPQHRATGLGFIDNVVYEIQGKSDKENTHKLKYILNEAEKWRKKHGTQFKISKYILIHYIHNRRVRSNASVTINEITIELSKKTKYLGIIFDQVTSTVYR
jgi:hypothetical protein